jgi:hypothetical protein
MKIRAVGAELFDADNWTDRQTDRQTNMTKLIVTFRKFAITLKIYGFTIITWLVFQMETIFFGEVRIKFL